jgi:CubicO group peptidase (beta-lactamase class C family)
MPALTAAKPEDVGLDPARLRRADDLLEQWVRQDQVPAAALCVGRNGKALEPHFFGRQRPERDAPPLRKDALFLLASITKPVTVTAVMLLAERGRLSLEDPVAAYVPRFAAHGKGDVRLRHLATHTSGLPDMLPNNEQLRAAHQPLARFVEETCRLAPQFAPGTNVQYQSMGIAVLAEVVHQVSGQTLAEFLRQELFVPLGMHDTSLGWQPEKKERIAGLRISPKDQKTDWNWNTPYWLGFGAPWGGLISSPADMARFCLMMLNGGALDGVRVLSPATVRAMTTNQLSGMPQVSEVERRCRPWGLGWRLQWLAEPSSFGDLLGPHCYGHWGATGTLAWLDPDARAFGLLFTTQPLEERYRLMARISNIVAAALV